ncbi:EthD family reductase [Pseudaminobacter arsenicus]|uniref:EthD family reductase n=1 Tax=Borborobacter arsenicus TaxID=1851146 RepID=A0A432V3K9_9HYPH|nr:EthD family reductase [Pseudaminobacter arsenicus]RUM96680.1 EthD family reductase [Pseudaminobacter arsenicus]
MIVRSAFLEGHVEEADQEQFDRSMRENVLPAIRSYPGIRDVRLRRLVVPEEGAPPAYMIFDLYFDSVADMNAALASETRQIVRSKIAENMGPFKGRVYHLVFAENE